ncbi:MAG: ATP-dependent helicase [Alphaproteobacteria bacterium]|nr:MAG: ATP-dependent helicase [Alphaproteobacteria bacterium]
MSQSGNLNALLNTLTPVQLEAATWADGALMLLAGPGSGKTRVLTSRIAKLLVESDPASWRVLALTFTTRAADEMRSRISDIAPAQMDRLLVGTFHSFAVELLRQSGSHVGVRTDFKIYSTLPDRMKLLEEAVRSSDIDFPEPLNKAFFVLDGLRDRLVSPEECGKLFQSEQRAQYFSQLYTTYHAHLASQNALDFPAIIYKCHELLESYPLIAERYRRTFRYICIDEFQDTNTAQYRLIKVFTGKAYRNVCVVADDDQVIYQWNGASPKRLQDFRADFDADVLQMPTNFRCPPEVVHMANRLVSNNKLRSPGKRPLEAGKASETLEERVRLVTFDTDVSEAAGIAQDIKQNFLTRTGTVAVIARTKGLLEGVKAALTELGIDARIAQRRDAFESVPYQWLHASLLIANRRSDEDAFRAFVESGNALWGYEADADVLISEAALSHGDLLRAWVTWAKEATAASAHASSIVVTLSKSLADRSDFHVFCRTTVNVFDGNKGEFENAFASVDEDAGAWKSLYREIIATVGSDAPLDTFLQELEMRSKEPPLRDGTIPLLTIHSSKGNEFNHVYLAGLAEDILPSFQSKKEGPNSPQLEEERRNCFVAITRCIDTLTLSYASRYGTWARQPSRFLQEMLQGQSGDSSYHA